MPSDEPSDDLLAFLGYVEQPRYELLVDPCVALDVLGLWMTMRVVYETGEGLRFDELDVHVPVDPKASRVELGHQKEMHDLLGDSAQEKVLAAARGALFSPLQLVVELNGSTHGVEMMLEASGEPKLWALSALAKMIDANHHEMVDSVLAFRISNPRPQHLEILARVFFGEPWAELFAMH